MDIICLSFSGQKNEDEGETEEAESVRTQVDTRGADGFVYVQEVSHKHRQHTGQSGGRRLHDHG